MAAINKKPNRKYPSLSYVSGDLKNHTDLLTTIRNTLEIGQRRTADFPSSFVQIRDLIDLGVIDEDGNLNTDLFASTVTSDVVESLVAGNGITLDTTDPENPIIALDLTYSAVWTSSHTWTDNDEIRLGTGNDLRLYHDGTNSIIRNDTGVLRLQGGANIGLEIAATGALSSAKAATWTGNHTFSPASGHTVVHVGNLRLDVDSLEIQLGASQDLRFFHDGTDSFIRNDTGILKLNQGANGALWFNANRAFGLGGASYGAAGQILTSNGTTAPPSWTTPASGSANTLETEIMADTPTAFWKLDEASGTFADSSGNGFHLNTINGTVTYQSTVCIPTLPAVSFARFGVDSGAYIVGKLGSSPPLTGDWTLEISAMVPALATAINSLVNMGGNGETEILNYQFQMSTTSAGLFQMFWERVAGTDVAVVSATNIGEAKPFHLVCVKDGTAKTVSFYVNGMFMSTTTYTLEPTGGTGTINSGVGAMPGGANQIFVGAYAAVYLGSKLSAARIAAHARAAGLFAN